MCIPLVHTYICVDERWVIWAIDQKEQRVKSSRPVLSDARLMKVGRRKQENIRLCWVCAVCGAGVENEVSLELLVITGPGSAHHIEKQSFTWQQLDHVTQGLAFHGNMTRDEWWCKQYYGQWPQMNYSMWAWVVNISCDSLVECLSNNFMILSSWVRPSVGLLLLWNAVFIDQVSRSSSVKENLNLQMTWLIPKLWKVNN